ncbi:MAG TPA: hypothetical protein VLI92_04845 [Candidatus Saccharimonadales bacterium]|nr:hypothetical protein [Candidatus Saccharimonadales bacterium]
MIYTIIQKSGVPILHVYGKPRAGEVTVELLASADHCNWDKIKDIRKKLLLAFKELSLVHKGVLGGTSEQVIHNAIAQLMTLSTPSFEVKMGVALTLDDIDHLIEAD